MTHKCSCMGQVRGAGGGRGRRAAVGNSTWRGRGVSGGSGDNGLLVAAGLVAAISAPRVCEVQWKHHSQEASHLIQVSRGFIHSLIYCCSSGPCGIACISNEEVDVNEKSDETLLNVELRSVWGLII